MIFSLLIQVGLAQDSIKFFVAGHAYGSPGIDNKGFHPRFQNHMNQNHQQFDFGIFTGDFILKPTEKNWNEIDSAMSDWTPETHFVAGNHDYGKGVIFEERSGGLNKSFQKDNSLFVILNLTTTGWLITPDHWKMIHQALEDQESNVDHIFLFTHQVAYVNSDPLFKNVRPNSYDGSAGDLKFFETNLEKFSELKVPIYVFTGDVGAIHGRSGSSYHQVKNLHLISSGMGNNETDNYLSVQVNLDSIKITRVNLINGDSCPLSEELIRITKP